MSLTLLRGRIVLSAAVFTATLLGTACSDSTAPGTGSASATQNAQLPSTPTAPNEINGFPGDTISPLAALKPTMAAMAAEPVVCYVKVSAPARSYSSTGSPRVSASGWIDHCTGPVLQANVTTFLWQLYGGAWHKVAEKTATKVGTVSQLKAVASVPCTGALTGYWFKVNGFAYATSTSGLSTFFLFPSAQKWITC